MHVRRIRGTAALLAVALAVGPLLAACSSSQDYSQVDASEYERNVALPTTSIVERVLDTTTTTTTPPRRAVPAVAGPDAALASLVDQLISNPELIALVGRLSSADPTALADLFQIDLSILDELGLTLNQLQGLAAIVAGIDPDEVAASVGSEIGAGVEAGIGAGVAAAVDTDALSELLALATGIEATALAAIDGVTRETIGGLVTALSDALDQVDPALLTLIATLLDRLDPGGLGALAQDQTTSAVLAVVAGAALRAEPAAAPELRGQIADDPELTELLDRLVAVGAVLEQDQAAALAALGTSLDAESLGVAVRLVEVLQDPATAELLARISA